MFAQLERLHQRVRQIKHMRASQRNFVAMRHTRRKQPKSLFLLSIYDIRGAQKKA
jgi:hypothetical protein